MTTLDFATYAENKDSMRGIAAEIQRLEAFEDRTTVQESKLGALRSSYRVLSEQTASHERASLAAGVTFDGLGRLHSEEGHTPRSLDDDPLDE